MFTILSTIVRNTKSQVSERKEIINIESQTVRRYKKRYEYFRSTGKFS